MDAFAASAPKPHRLRRFLAFIGWTVAGATIAVAAIALSEWIR